LAQKIRERLAALALAHDLTRPGLVGAETRSPPPTTLHSVTRAIFAPYLEPSTSSERDRLFIDGIDLPVAQNSMTSLALLLHEFATNAVKYGSLSVPQGSIELECKLEDGTVVVTWQEKGGPSLDGAPNQHGFGSMLARQIVSGHFGGKLSYSWNKDGLIIRVAVPKERLAASSEERLH
jgi:two-component system, chemotaxis family, CheB/CheR fusion protein